MNKIVLPNYDNSILNLITSILKHYKVKTKYNGLTKIDGFLNNNYKNIVLMVLDGMGHNLIQQISSTGFFCQNEVAYITSVCPSTTTAALTTYYSGKPPIETGWIAWSQYFKEYGRAIDLLPGTDSYTHILPKDARLNIYDLISYKTIFEQIEESSPDVNAYEIIPGYCKPKCRKNLRADNIKDMCEYILSLCGNKERNFIFAYNDHPDKILHKKGCGSIEVKDFILDSEKLIQDMCKNLENTLLIISADHGHNDIKEHYNILDLKEIQDCLIMPATLESRAVSFWVKENRKKDFENIFEKQFKDKFILYTKEEFLKNNLLGFGNTHPKIDDFIGNYIAISISDAIIKLETNISTEKPNKLSTHCGFTSNEMLVPVIVIDK